MRVGIIRGHLLGEVGLEWMKDFYLFFYCCQEGAGRGGGGVGVVKTFSYLSHLRLIHVMKNDLRTGKCMVYIGSSPSYI